MSHDDGLRAELTRVRGELLADARCQPDAARLARYQNALSGGRRTALQPDHFDSLFIALYLPETDSIRFDYSVDEGVVDDVPFERPLDEAPLNARIIRGRLPLHIDDLDDDPIRRSGQADPVWQHREALARLAGHPHAQRR